MTDTNTRNAEAVERVAKAICSEDIHLWPKPDEDPHDYQPRYWQTLATAAIAAHNSWLRERSRDADVVEAAAIAQWEFNQLDDELPWGQVGEESQAIYRDFATATLTAALTAMIGKEQPHDDR